MFPITLQWIFNGSTDSHYWDVLTHLVIQLHFGDKLGGRIRGVLLAFPFRSNTNSLHLVRFTLFQDNPIIDIDLKVRYVHTNYQTESLNLGSSTGNHLLEQIYVSHATSLFSLSVCVKPTAGVVLDFAVHQKVRYLPYLDMIRLWYDYDWICNSATSFDTSKVWKFAVPLQQQNPRPWSHVHQKVYQGLLFVHGWISSKWELKKTRKRFYTWEKLSMARKISAMRTLLHKWKFIWSHTDCSADYKRV